MKNQWKERLGIALLIGGLTAGAMITGTWMVHRQGLEAADRAALEASLWIEDYAPRSGEGANRFGELR